MKYKVNDRVKIKSFDWYYENKDILGNIDCGDALMTFEKARFCGKIVTISSMSDVTDAYRIEEDNGLWNWTDEMIEGLVEEETLIERVDDKGLPFNEWLSYKGAFHIPDGYELKDENGNVINATKIVLEKKKKEYPKTYEECCRILGLNSEITDSELLFYYPLKCGDYTTIRLPEMEKFEKFIQLYLCRNAYWKIAGEEMGLGKPWEPDDTEVYNIYRIKNTICLGGTFWSGNCYLLEFPTKEMRDAFKENFDKDIEICKELL